MLSEAVVCLALTMYFEARGEGPVGMVAVGQVVLNRVDDPRFPKTICGVVKQRGVKSLRKCQFSWYCGEMDIKGVTDKNAWIVSTELAGSMIDGGLRYNSLTGAHCYRAAWASAPPWVQRSKEITQIKEHIFYAC